MDTKPVLIVNPDDIKHNRQPYFIAIVGHWHPKYGAWGLSWFSPSPLEVLHRLWQLKRQGDPNSEIPHLQNTVVKMACLICRDTAIRCTLLYEQSEQADDVRRLVEMCLPPVEPTPEAFPIWLGVERRGAQLELEAIQSAGLAPDSEALLSKLVRLRMEIVQSLASTPEVQAQQVVAAWCQHQLMFEMVGPLYMAVTMTYPDKTIMHKALELHPIPTDYLLAADEVRTVAVKQFRQVFNRALNRNVRINRNPGGTGHKPEYEHEITESQLPLPEDAPSPLETAISDEPDPAEVVVNRDIVNRLLERACNDQLDRDIVNLLLQDPNLDHKEIAEILGKPHDLIRQRWSRLRKRACKIFSATA